MGDRASIPAQTEAEDLLLASRQETAEQEARNVVLQFDETGKLIRESASGKTIEITPALIASLNRIAIQGIRRSAGHLRLVPMAITNTRHQPPPPDEVEGLLEAMCAYLAGAWNQTDDDLRDALHLAAFVMWRLNCIHPLRDGNGRTSRAVAYLILSVRLGHELIGTPTIADQIVGSRVPYYLALDQADEAWATGRVDVSAMKRLLVRMLARQLSGDAAETA